MASQILGNPYVAQVSATAAPAFLLQAEGQPSQGVILMANPNDPIAYAETAASAASVSFTMAGTDTLTALAITPVGSSGSGSQALLDAGTDFTQSGSVVTLTSSGMTKLNAALPSTPPQATTGTPITLNPTFLDGAGNSVQLPADATLTYEMVAPSGVSNQQWSVTGNTLTATAAGTYILTPTVKELGETIQGNPLSITISASTPSATKGQKW